MRGLKTGVLAVIILFLITIMVGCVNQGVISSQNSDQVDIAVITKATSSDFWKAVQRGVSTVSSEYNLNVTFDGPENEEDYERQNELIQKAINNGVKAIVVSIIDTNESVGVISRAKKAGIPVVIIDSGINMNDIDAEISTDNYEAGEKVAEAMIKDIPGQIQVGIVNFDVNTTNGQQRETGFRNRLEQEGNAQIAETINVESNTASAKEGCIRLLKEHPQINAIATFNEWTTLGVGYAIEELGKKDDIKVIAFDNNVISIGMLEDGEVDGLMVQNPFAMGYLGVENAYSLYRKQQKSGKVIYTDSVLVTRENMFDTDIQKLLFPVDSVE